MDKNNNTRTKQNSALVSAGKIPPQAIDFETAVLGACLLEQGAYDRVGYILSPDVFYKNNHRLILKAIEALSAKSEPIDILTVTQQLQSLSLLDEVGGPYSIAQLTNNVSSSANIEYHSMILYQKYVQREIIRECGNLLTMAYEDDFDIVDNLYSEVTTRLDSVLAGKRADKSMMIVLTNHQKELDRRADLYNKGGLTGVNTGSADLNRMTQGWQNNDLIIVAARPGMGKTAISLNLFTKQPAVQGKSVLVFSLEMDDISLADRLICSCGGINPDHLKSGNLSTDEWNAYSNAQTQLQDLPIYIDDTASVDLKHIRAVSRTKRRKGECDMIVIDYLQLIDTPQDKYSFKNREREVAEISRGLKVLAKELKVPVILLCQLSRQVEMRGDKMPQLSDLRESGAIEQDADKVIFLFRPDYYGIIEDDKGNSLKNIIMLLMRKNRSGKQGTIIMKHSPDMTQFFDTDFNVDSL